MAKIVVVIFLDHAQILPFLKVKIFLSAGSLIGSDLFWILMIAHHKALNNKFLIIGENN